MSEELKKRLVPEVTVTLGGEERRFRLDFNALARIEEATGKNLLLNPNWLDSLSVKDLRAFVWGLLHVGPGEMRPELEEVGAWLDPGSMREVTQMLLGLWKASTPKGKPGKKGEPAPFGPPLTSG